MTQVALKERGVLCLKGLAKPRVHHLHKFSSLDTFHVIFYILALLALERGYGWVGTTSCNNIGHSVDAG